MAIGFRLIGRLALGLSLAACGSWSQPGPTPTRIPPTPTAAPSLSLAETGCKDLENQDFDSIHAPVGGDTNPYLILGNVPVARPAADLPAELAVFLGRWEGYDYSPPVRQDHKGVLVIQEISPQGGRAVLWAGTHLQYPYWVKEIRFRVVPGATPSIEWQCDFAGGPNSLSGQGTFSFAYDPGQGRLRGGLNVPSAAALDGPTEMDHGQTFHVYKDYAQYLAGKRLYLKTFRSGDLERYGAGYLLYLPDGYEADLGQTWPLIFFLHGAGDRGDNVLVLAKSSPFMMIRERGPLPVIIAAPLLGDSPGYATFPEAYLDGVLEEIRSDYRVDPKRIYLTGLSMGGEATYRFALHQPDTFAAIAPLCAFFQGADAAEMRRLRDVPVWAIHGADDTVIPPARGQEPVRALEQAGGDVRFTLLEGHDHDVWTDTYLDPAFYDWLLQHHRP